MSDTKSEIEGFIAIPTTSGEQQQQQQQQQQQNEQQVVGTKDIKAPDQGKLCNIYRNLLTYLRALYVIDKWPANNNRSLVSYHILYRKIILKNTIIVYINI